MTARHRTVRSLGQASHVLQNVMDLRARQLGFPGRHVGLSLVNRLEQIFIGLLGRGGRRKILWIGTQQFIAVSFSRKPMAAGAVSFEQYLPSPKAVRLN